MLVDITLLLDLVIENLKYQNSFRVTDDDFCLKWGRTWSELRPEGFLVWLIFPLLAGTDYLLL